MDNRESIQQNSTFIHTKNYSKLQIEENLLHLWQTFVKNKLPAKARNFLPKIRKKTQCPLSTTSTQHY